MKKAIHPDAKSQNVVERGVRNLDDVGELLCAMMSDLVTGKISPSAGNKIAAKTGKFLKQYENELKRHKRDKPDVC